MFITKSLLKIQSDPSQKVYQFYKGSLQKLYEQASKFSIILHFFSFQKLSKFEIEEFFNCFFFQNLQTHRCNFSLFTFFPNRKLCCYLSFTILTILYLLLENNLHEGQKIKMSLQNFAWRCST